jgi:Putative adhesin
VTVRGTAESQMHVQGIKRWRRGRERDVQFVVARSGDDVYLCAIWTRRGGRCGEEHYKPRPARWLRIFRLLRRRSDMAASFEVMLPPGARVDATTVNGRVTVTEAGGDVKAETINGDIRASTMGGALSLKTINGSIRARATSLAKDAPIELETVNGSVRAELPSPLDADVRLSTVNGRITTDFPVALSGKATTRDLQGTVGSGGRPVRLKTVNGSVELKTKS